MMNEQNMLEVRNLTKHFKVDQSRRSCGGLESVLLSKRKTLGLVGRIRLQEINLCQDDYTNVRPHIGADPSER